VVRFAVGMVLVLTALVFSTGCAAPAPDVAFDISQREALEALKQMRKNPLPLERPLIISGGYLDPGTSTHRVIERFKRLTSTPELVYGTPYFSVGTFETARRRLIEKIESKYPSENDEWTVEVDVVGVSMGGLVARYAAMDNGGAHKRLKIKRLFTLATPHQGAKLAWLPPFDEKQRAMRTGSEFLCALDEALPGETYEIIPYVRLGDGVVGCDRSAPEGVRVRWIPNEPFGFSHLGVQNDPRLSVELARRIRGEPPVSGEPSPLPE